MEVAAGFAEHADVQAGRVIGEIERLGLAENTLIFYIWGDNGSSGEGQNGTISELLAQNGIPTTVDTHIQVLEEMGGLDVLGTPKVDNQYHAGWAWAGSTPYAGMKLMGSDLGGTRNPMAIRWPARIAADSTPRTQFHHCTDQALPAGRTTIEVCTEYAEARPGGPLNITITVNGEPCASGLVPVSAPLLFTANDCLDIGTCLGGPVSLDYYDRAPFPFTGTIERVHMRYTS
jgi:hypothetical protein